MPQALCAAFATTTTMKTKPKLQKKIPLCALQKQYLSERNTLSHQAKITAITAEPLKVSPTFYNHLRK